MESFKIVIDGKECEAFPGETVLKVAERNGIVIPVFCYHKELRPEGACRVCLVEVEGAPRLVTACTLKAMPNMVVRTNTPRVKRARATIIRMILNNHALECKECDKSGECELQMTGFRHASKEVKYKESVRRKGIFVEGKLIAINTDRCILCRRCVRMCGENMGNRVLGIMDRGYRAYVSPFNGNFEEGGCEHCGSCIDVCPVGSLLDKTFKHEGRPWKLDKIWTTCGLCGSSCYMEVDTSGGKIRRVVGRIGVNHAHNKGYLCVGGKWGWDIVYSSYRFKKPMLKVNGKFKEISFEEAISVLIEKLERGDFGVFIDSALTCEEVDLITEKFKTKEVVSDAFNYQKFLKRIVDRVEVASLEKVFDADVLVVVGDFIEEVSPVVATLLRLKVIQDRKRIIRIGQFPSKLDSVSYRVFLSEDIAELLTSQSLGKLLRRKRISLILGGTIYDLCKADEIAEVIGEQFSSVSLFPVPVECNSFYVSSKLTLGRNLSSSVNLYFVTSNEKFELNRKGEFTVLFTPFLDEFALEADLLIPMETFLEKDGKILLPGGIEKILNKAVKPEVSLKDFLENLQNFVQRVVPNQPVFSSCYETSNNLLIVISKHARNMLSNYSAHIASVAGENRVLGNLDSNKVTVNGKWVLKVEKMNVSTVVPKKVLFVERFNREIIEILKLSYPCKELKVELKGD